MMESKHCAVVFFVLAIFAVLCLSVEGQQDCKSGLECFPAGIPDELSPSDELYYCCPEKNTTRNSNKTEDGSVNCTCVPDFTLEEKIQKWADDSKDEGRMCNRGAERCSGSKSNGTINYKFLDCCWPQEINERYVSSTTTIYDGDKEEYIGCRCNASLPSPDPTAYTVPQTSLYNSTGESCFYDKGCEDRPALKCTSPGVTFCCYGSRGIVTANDGDGLTRCTCTNQVYGEMCAGAQVPIANTEQTCLTDCSNRDDDDVCRDSEGNERCCDHNMAVSARQHNGNFTDCTCTTDRFNYCGVTAPACLTDCSNRDDDDVCRDSEGNERCCEHNMAVSATLLNGNFTDCTCTMDTVKSCEVTSSALSSVGQSWGLLLVMLVSSALLGQKDLQLR